MRHVAPRLSLVIPTRNEAANVEKLISGICTVLPGPTKELVFVDDSDDDTPRMLQRLLAQADCPGLIMARINGNRVGGLSTAVVRGFSISSGELICTLDADLQHPTSAIPMLIETAYKQRADVVVGSRYIDGGNARDGFDGTGRHLISVAGRLLARKLIPEARMTTDPLSGFFLVRRPVVDAARLQPIGYKILLEVLVRGQWQRLADVPYAFHSRNDGVSKATMREGMRFLRHLNQLRRERGAGRRTGPKPLIRRTLHETPPTWLRRNGHAPTNGAHPKNEPAASGVNDVKERVNVRR